MLKRNTTTTLKYLSSLARINQRTKNYKNRFVYRLLLQPEILLVCFKNIFDSKFSISLNAAMPIRFYDRIRFKIQKLYSSNYFFSFIHKNAKIQQRQKWLIT